MLCCSQDVQPITVIWIHVQRLFWSCLIYMVLLQKDQKFLSLQHNM